jgi:hypothetical protein
MSQEPPANFNIERDIPTGRVRTRSNFLLTQRQTAPYVALRGTTLTIVSEESSSCGQRGRVCRVFWRGHTPWVLVRLCDGVMLSMPWSWTDLPVIQIEDDHRLGEGAITLLAPSALRDLVRFVRGQHK